MFEKIKSSIKRRQLKTIVPFSKSTDEKSVCFSICAHSESISQTLADEFSALDQIEIVKGNIFGLNCDAIVSPANSFGEMSGGLDKDIDDFYQGQAQLKASKRLEAHFGELPVGQAVTIDMQSARFPYLILSPTMRIPGLVADTHNAYLSMRALLVEIANHNSRGNNKIRSVAIPSLCTGVGGMKPKDSAEQMRAAFENVVMSGWQSVRHPAMAPFATNG